MTHAGLHHVTAVCGAPAQNLGFYTGVLGLRLVKKTVNFDDPGTYHLYYGDELGRPGTVLTFFPILHATEGHLGAGETSETALSVPRGAVAWWVNRFSAHSIAHDAPAVSFGAPVLRFRDPSGMKLALVEDDRSSDAAGWAGSDVPSGRAIRGLAGVTLLLRDTVRTANILTDVFGLTEAGREGGRFLYNGTANQGATVILQSDKDAPRGRQGVGSVHHIAFRASDDAIQAAMALRLKERHGLQVTEQRDRRYFRSVYCREPGGVLFEIATDTPGFTVDEAASELGRSLKLPSELEGQRDTVMLALPPL